MTNEMTVRELEEKKVQLELDISKLLIVFAEEIESRNFEVKINTGNICCFDPNRPGEYMYGKRPSAKIEVKL